MTDLERDPKEPMNSADLSRARQRKLRRDRKSGAGDPAEDRLDRRRTARQRTLSQKTLSVRERLVATHIKVPSESIEKIQGKLKSSFESVSRQLNDETESIKRSLSEDTRIPRNQRRKSDALRRENLFEATNRTETQRKVNSERPFVPRKNRRQYDARSEASPPVMVRGGMGGMAFGRAGASRLHKQKIPKRRFDVPLRVQGAEVRLPSVPLIHLGWRAISLMMVIAMIASLFMVWKGPMFQVKEVQAEGLKRLTAGDLNTVMRTFGASVFTLDPNLLEETLTQAFPEFSSIAVRVNLPAKVKVVVTERAPVIAWTQDGKESWVDVEGISFPPRGNPESALVRVEGHGTPPGLSSTAATTQVSLPPGVPPNAATPIPSLRLDSNLVASILALGAKMPADTLIVYDSEHGLGWNDPNGWEVYFGAEDQDMEMKLNIYQTMVDYLQNNGIQPELISVEYVHAPYYRMER